MILNWLPDQKKEVRLISLYQNPMKNLLTSIALSAVFMVSSFSSLAQDNLLGAMGSMSAIAVYNTYIAIGGIGDGYTYDVYTPENATSYLQEQLDLMDNLNIQLTNLINSDELSDELDRDYVKDILSLVGGLKRQASYLKDYIANGNLESDLSAYDSQRLHNWDDIERILGIE